MNSIALNGRSMAVRVNSDMNEALETLLTALVAEREAADLAAGYNVINRALVLADVEERAGRDVANAVDELIGQMMSRWGDAGMLLGYRLAKDPGVLLFEDGIGGRAR